MSSAQGAFGSDRLETAVTQSGRGADALHRRTLLRGEKYRLAGNLAEKVLTPWRTTRLRQRRKLCRRRVCISFEQKSSKIHIVFSGGLC